MRKILLVIDMQNDFINGALGTPEAEAIVDRVAEEIAKIAAERQAEELVMGFPRNMDGTEGPRADLYRAFAALVEEKSGMPVRLWDERRTTIEAHQILHASGKKMKAHKKNVDAVAASLILEGYLTWLARRRD